MKPVSTLHTGRLGENAAAQYLEQKGYRIVARNYRAGRCEIDLIAWAADNILVFVEVKTRKGEAFGGPEAAITRKKQAKIMRAAGVYMEETGYGWAIRFDTMAVILRGERVVEIRHHEDAFFD